MVEKLLLLKEVRSIHFELNKDEYLSHKKEQLCSFLLREEERYFYSEIVEELTLQPQVIVCTEDIPSVTFRKKAFPSFESFLLKTLTMLNVTFFIRDICFIGNVKYVSMLVIDENGEEVICF